MRILFLIFTLTGTLSVFGQKAQLGFCIPMEFPNKTIMPAMSNSLGFGFSVGYKPFFRLPMLAEFKMSFGSLASRSYSSQVQLYQYYNPTTVHSTFASKYNKYLIGPKFMIGYDFRVVRGFVTPQIGLATLKTTSSYNFNDYNNETQQGHKTPQRDINSVYGIEIGTEILLNGIFKSMGEKTKHRITLSAHLLNSFNTCEYTNVHGMFDVNTVDASTIDASATYISLPNKYVYENYATQLYTSKLAMWGINIGYIIYIMEDGE